MKYLIGMIATLVVLGAAGLGIIWTGAYNVAASDSHEGFVYWAFDTTMQNSVQNRAEDVPVPVGFSAEQARNGFGDFDEMCAQCHGAPGEERTEWAMGMRPMPPPLSEEATHWNSAELFWIIRYGIKMSGMPAMGPTHSDEDLWNIVAFVEQLPNLTAELYAELREDLGGEGHHGEGGAEQGGGDQESGSEPSGETGGGQENAGAGGAEGGGPQQEGEGGGSVVMEPPAVEE